MKIRIGKISDIIKRNIKNLEDYPHNSFKLQSIYKELLLDNKSDYKFIISFKLGNYENTIILTNNMIKYPLNLFKDSERITDSLRKELAEFK